MRGPSRTTRPWLPCLLLGLLPAPLGWAQAPAAPSADHEYPSYLSTGKWHGVR